MTEDIRQVQEQEINTYQIRVHMLEQDLWEATEPVKRINLMIQLADAVTSLLHLESNAKARVEAEQ
jgi:hypothetical protein